MSIFESLENINVSEGCFKDIVALVEEYINELQDGVYRRMKNKAKAIAQAQEEILPEIENSEDKRYVEGEIKKRKRQAAKAESKYENQVIARAKKEEAEKKAKKNIED